FQAEDGIRDRNVTGVQTCALPISNTEVSSDDSTSDTENETHNASNETEDKDDNTNVADDKDDNTNVAQNDNDSVASNTEVSSDDSTDRKSTRLNSSHVSISYAV